MATDEEVLNDRITFRCKGQEKEAFAEHCREKLGKGPGDFLREVVKATLDGRVTITLTETQIKTLGETYNVDRNRSIPDS